MNHGSQCLCMCVCVVGAPEVRWGEFLLTFVSTSIFFFHFGESTRHFFSARRASRILGTYKFSLLSFFGESEEIDYVNKTVERNRFRLFFVISSHDSSFEYSTASAL